MAPPPPKRKGGKKSLAEHIANIDVDDQLFIQQARHIPKLTRETIEPLIDMAFSPIEEVQRDAVCVIETLSQLNSVNGVHPSFELRTTRTHPARR